MSEIKRFVKHTKGKAPKFRIVDTAESSNFYIEGLKRAGFEEDSSFKGVLEEKEVTKKVKELNKTIEASVSKKAKVVKPEPAKEEVAPEKEVKATVKKAEKEEVEATQEEKEEEVAPEKDSIEALRAEYEEVIDRPVPRSKNKDANWIKSEIEKKKNETK